MQKIVLFIEPNDDAYSTPSKIGHLFMNRFAIDEDSSFEIVKVLELEKISEAASRPKHPFEIDRNQKGIDLMGAKELFRLLKFSIDYTVPVYTVQCIVFRSLYTNRTV